MLGTPPTPATPPSPTVMPAAPGSPATPALPDEPPSSGEPPAEVPPAGSPALPAAPAVPPPDVPAGVDPLARTHRSLVSLPSAGQQRSAPGNNNSRSATQDSPESQSAVTSQRLPSPCCEQPGAESTT